MQMALTQHRGDWCTTRAMSFGRIIFHLCWVSTQFLSVVHCVRMNIHIVYRPLTAYNHYRALYRVVTVIKIVINLEVEGKFYVGSFLG